MVDYPRGRCRGLGEESRKEQLELGLSVPGEKNINWMQRWDSWVLGKILKNRKR